MSRPASVVHNQQAGASYRHVQASFARPCAPLLVGLVLQAASAAFSQSASADEWIVIPSIELKQSVTDNAGHAPRGRERADTFTTIRPGVSISGEGERLNVNLDYFLTRTQYFDNTELSNWTHNLLGTATAELVPELLFFDARAAIVQQTVNPTGAVSASPDSNGSNPNSRTVKTYSLSPYMLNRFGGFAQSELRYLFNQVRQESAGNSTTHRFSETLDSGDDFTRFRWQGVVDVSETEGSNNSDTDASLNDPFGGGARDSSRRLAAFSPEYAINRYLILLGSVGYERIEDETLREEPDGIIGNAGVRVNPGPRSTFRVLWNHRFESNYFTGDASYLIGPSSRVDFAYTRDIQTSQSLYADNLSYLGTDDYGNFIDTRSLTRFQLENSAFGLSNAAFLQERYSLRFSTELQRDSFLAELYREERESRNVFATQTTYGATLSWSRDLSQLLRLTADVTYTDSEFGAISAEGEAREDHTVRGGPGLIYSFNETLTGTLNYDFLYRFSNAAAGDLRENIVTVGLRKIF
jgi:uncharacterized protein (PEP-CTERM system associated)